MMKESVKEEGITLCTYVPKTGAPKYTKQTLTDIKEN